MGGGDAAANGGGATGPDLAALVADQNLTAALKVLEAAIGNAEAEYANAASRLAQLHINRGYCHQCLSLSRKALKVRRRGGLGACKRKAPVLCALPCACGLSRGLMRPAARPLAGL
jgi:hypothetical protein